MLNNLLKFLTTLKTLVLNNRRLALLLFSFLVLFGLYRVLFSSGGPMAPMDLKVIEVATVSQGEIKQTARFIGTIRSVRATVMTSKVNGTLDSIVPAGQAVQKGTLIAKIDTVDIQKTFLLSKTAEEIAKGQYERALQLRQKGHSSTLDVENKKQIWIEAQKTLSNAKISLEETQFLAPFDGIVGVFKVREGAQVRPGDPIVSFYDPSRLIVEFDIPVSLLPYIKDGQPLEINGKTYALTHVQRLMDEETHMCPAYANFDCKDCTIGSTIDVDLVVQQKKGVLVIPFESTFLRNGKQFVYVAKTDTEKNQMTAELVPVELGIREKEQVEVVSGLNAGDTLITQGTGRLYPGVLVKIHESEPSSQENKQG